MGKKNRARRWDWHQNSGMDWIARSTRLAIYARDDFACVRCEAPEDGAILTLDHIDDGAGNGPENLVTCCHSCNSARKDRKIEIFDREYAHRARAQASLPIDRAHGLALAKARWPERFAKQVAAQKALRLKRAS